MTRASLYRRHVEKRKNASFWRKNNRYIVKHQRVEGEAEAEPGDLRWHLPRSPVKRTKCISKTLLLRLRKPWGNSTNKWWRAHRQINLQCLCQESLTRCQMSQCRCRHRWEYQGRCLNQVVKCLVWWECRCQIWWGLCKCQCKIQLRIWCPHQISSEWCHHQINSGWCHPKTNQVWCLLRINPAWCHPRIRWCPKEAYLKWTHKPLCLSHHKGSHPFQPVLVVSRCLHLNLTIPTKACKTSLKLSKSHLHRSDQRILLLWCSSLRRARWRRRKPRKQLLRRNEGKRKNSDLMITVMNMDFMILMVWTAWMLKDLWATCNRYNNSNLMLSLRLFRRYRKMLTFKPNLTRANWACYKISLLLWVIWEELQVKVVACQAKIMMDITQIT